MTRLQEVSREFSVADEALRKSMLKCEALEAHIKRLLNLMQPKQPKRVEVIGKNGKEIWSLPL